MNVIARLIYLLVIAWSLVAGLNTFGLLLLAFYLIYYTGYELVLVVFLVDVYREALLGLPIFTIIVLLSTIFVDLLKPRLLMYTGRNEIVS
jgi:hypothetical protein